MSSCQHVDQIERVVAPNDVCADCVDLGDTWVHLRQCRICGYVGCCDDSKNRHASRHFTETDHPIIRSLEPGEGWNWCYIDAMYVDVNEASLQPPVSGLDSGAVIRNYLLIAGIYTLAASIIWGVNTLFLLDAGLTVLEVFIANAVFTGSMMVFEIPTGVLADTRGRRVSFLLSVAIVLLGTLGYVGAAATGAGLISFCLMSVLLGLGYTFYSGAVEAWLVDSLQATGFSHQLEQVFARGSMVSGVAMLLGSISGGVLGSIDLAIPFLVRAALLAIVFVVAYFTMHDLGFTPRAATVREIPAEMRRIAGVSIEYGWNNRAVRLLMIAGVIQALYMAWGFYAWQPYFLELLGTNAPWVAGVVAALISLATITGNTIVEWLTRFCGRRTTLLLWAAAIQTVALVGVGLAGSFWIAVVLYLVVMGAMGVWGPVRQAYMHQSIPSAERASVISFDSMLSSGGSMVGQVGLGAISQAQSFATGYVLSGIASIFVLPVIVRLRQRREVADKIVGRAGAQAACAAQGMPDVAGIDATTVAAD